MQQITADNKLKKLLIIGDRVLVEPKKPNEKTGSGLYLPAGVQEKEVIQSGYVIKVGPGIPLPFSAESEDGWKPKEEQLKYLPLQIEEGDLAIFLQNNAFEVQYEGKQYFIVPQNAILMVEREENL